MFEFTREDFPRLADGDLGRVAPFIFGLYKRAIPIAIEVGHTDRLADDLTIFSPPNGGAIALSSVDNFDRFSDAGKVQIGKERIGYTSKNRGTLELQGVTRAVDGTAADAHTSGEVVYEVFANFKYVVCENPRLVHFTKSVDVIYMDGRRIKDFNKPPKITVNLDDRDVVAGRSFVTLTIDVSSIPANEIRTPLPSPPPRRVFRSGSSNYVPPMAPTIPGYGASIGGGGGSVGGIGSGGIGNPFNVGASQSIGVSSGSEGYYVTVSAPPQMSITYEFETPVLGNLEVDVTGLQDDSLGTITGGALTLLDRPAWIVRTLLREAWGELDDSNYNLATFDTTHLLQVGDGFKWALAYEGQAFLPWKDQVLMEGKAHLFNWGGRWYYVYRRRTAPVFTFDRDNTTKPYARLSMTPRTDLTTILSITWSKGLTMRRAVLRSERGIARYGVQRNRSLNLGWIYEEAPARLLGAYWLGQWDNQRLLVAIPTEHEVMGLEGLDTFRLTTPIMSQYGNTKVIFHVQEVTPGPEKGTWMVSGAQADDTGDAASGGGVSTSGGGLSILGSWKFDTPRSKSLVGSWTLGAPGLPVLSGSEVQPGLVPGGLAG